MSAEEMANTDDSLADERKAAYIERAIRYNIQRYMDLVGMNQGDMAKVLHVSRGAVSQMLTGYSRLKFRQMYLAAQALGVSIDDLMDPSYMAQADELAQKMFEIQTQADELTQKKFEIQTQADELTRKMSENLHDTQQSATSDSNELALSGAGAGGTQTRYFVMPEMNGLALAPRNAKPRYFVMPETNKLALVPREC
ncbi:helix-turn-helix domain-containing protein [Bifidobacterium catenulatum]|uniref:helix-turn-helix domain-containing protein n=1 Tax=Bifidobacterium catenulatum TaxID=1686 RepID=UPI003D3479B9